MLFAVNQQNVYTLAICVSCNVTFLVKYTQNIFFPWQKGDLSPNTTRPNYILLNTANLLLLYMYVLYEQALCRLGIMLIFHCICVYITQFLQHMICSATSPSHTMVMFIMDAPV